MSADDDRDDDDAATVIGRAESVREPRARPPVDSPTRKFDVQALTGPTRAMPAGYGMSRGVPPPRASAPRPAAGRPAAGRPAVPSVVDDPTSESGMTLAEAIDAELESTTSEFAIPDGTDPDGLLDLRGFDIPPDRGSELTIRMSIPDLPSDLLDAASEPGTQIQPPRAPAPPAITEMARVPGVPAAPLSLSSMPTPHRSAKTIPLSPNAGAADARGAVSSSAPTAGTTSMARPGSAAVAAPSAFDVVSAERPRGPAPQWVGRYIVACALASILGALVLGYLRVNRFW